MPDCAPNSSNARSASSFEMPYGSVGMGRSVSVTGWSWLLSATALMLLTKTKRRTPARRAARATRKLPVTLVARYAASGSDTASFMTCTRAARWTTTSQRSVDGHASSMPSKSSAPKTHSRTPLYVDCGWRTMPVTTSPRSSKTRDSALPTKPFAPVMAMCWVMSAFETGKSITYALLATLPSGVATNKTSPRSEDRKDAPSPYVPAGARAAPCTSIATVATNPASKLLQSRALGRSATSRIVDMPP
ncbi:protein of unknown function [Paraburkholderia kururiensis]